MRWFMIFATVVLVGLFAFTGCSDTGGDNATGNVVTGLESDPDKVTVYFFWGDGCPHCATEKPFLEDLEGEYSGDLEVKSYEVYNHPENVPLFREAARIHGIQARGVPATFIGERHWVGYNDGMGEEMERYIRSCIEQGCDDLIAD